MTAVQTRRISIYTRYGVARRLDCCPESVNADLKELLAQNGAPSAKEFEALTVCTEAVANWHRHGSGDLSYKLVTGPGLVEQCYDYVTEPFDVFPKVGHGIRVIRGYCTRVDYTFRNSRVHLRLLQRY